MDIRANFLALILLDAIEDENESDVNAILERNAVNAGYVPLERGIAPVHYACGMENEQLGIGITRRFLDSGTDPNVLTFDKMTPLHVAAMNGRVEIVRMLLEHGAKWDLYDVERKTAMQYAIEECHFEVLQLMRDHIFEQKYDRKRKQQQQQRPADITHAQPQESSSLSLTKFEQSMNQRIAKRQTSTPQNCCNTPPVNKNLLNVVDTTNDSVNGKYTPNRVHYNYDVTSPYYINITHRRHKPQPAYPTGHSTYTKLEDTSEANATYTVDSSPESATRPVNIFCLTKQNLEELSTSSTAPDRSRVSMIKRWRDKVHKSRERQSILQVYDNIGQMIDHVVANDHLNFTNTALKTTNDAETDSGASTSSLPDETADSPSVRTPANKMSLGQLIQRLSRLPTLSPELNTSKTFTRPPAKSPAAKSPASTKKTNTTYRTLPEVVVVDEAGNQNRKYLTVPKEKYGVVDAPPPTANDSVEDFIRSPNNDYFMQMTEAYVHTDDENGLVFYETKLLSNPGNRVAQQRLSPHDKRVAGSEQHNTTASSQSTNLTLPADYETDALRAELTIFGEPPGPITKSTKRLYIKRLIKYKRKTQQELAALLDSKKAGATHPKLTQYSVELQRTLRSPEAFQLIAAYAPYEKQSAQYFADPQQKRQLREGHLKQSFIYMLIDPRVSCNLPGESVYLEKCVVWHRFLQSIFYVGKGKSSRPYSHLYDAMKTHSRLHTAHLNKDVINANAKKTSIRKQRFNADLFKTAPEQSSNNKKLDRILDIWSNSVGVVCLHVFHNVMPAEAYTREAAIIDALSLQHLTNVKRGDYYGPARTWTMREKKYLGIALLYKAMQIYIAEGESQLSPSDLI